MADKKTTKTASGAQQYVAGSNSELNGSKSRAAIKRARKAIEDSDLTVRQKSKAGSLLMAADNANMSKIITRIAGSNNSTVRLFDSLEKGWEELAKKNDKVLATAGMATKKNFGSTDYRHGGMVTKRGPAFKRTGSK